MNKSENQKWYVCVLESNGEIQKKNPSSKEQKKMEAFVMVLNSFNFSAKSNNVAYVQLIFEKNQLHLVHIIAIENICMRVSMQLNCHPKNRNLTRIWQRARKKMKQILTNRGVNMSVTSDSKELFNL